MARLQTQYPFLENAVYLDQNAGKGGAIYAGWDSAREKDFQWLAFVDADGAVSPQETMRVIAEAVSIPIEEKTCTWAVGVRSDEKNTPHLPAQYIRKCLQAPGKVNLSSPREGYSMRTEMHSR